MPIDIRGFKVVYEDYAYIGLQIEPYFYTGPEGEFRLVDAQKLRVSVINHEAKFEVFDDYANNFAFLKDTKTT